eukprot:SAG11_NODE_27500_length_332_cov_0.652361_1_plen_76_part_01
MAAGALLGGGPPFIEGIKEHWPRMVVVAFVASLWPACFYLICVWLPTFVGACIACLPQQRLASAGEGAAHMAPMPC